MSKKSNVKTGYELFPIWDINSQSLQLWADEIFEKDKLKRDDIIYQTPIGVVKTIQRLCNQTGIKTKLDWGIRYISCKGESLFLDFRFKESYSSEYLENLLKKLKSQISSIYIITGYYEFDVERDIIRRRVKAGIASAREKGKAHGPPRRKKSR